MISKTENDKVNIPCFAQIKPARIFFAPLSDYFFI